MIFDGTLTICGKPFFERTTTDTATGVHLQGKWLNSEKVTHCVQTIYGVRVYEIIKPENYNID